MEEVQSQPFSLLSLLVLLSLSQEVVGLSLVLVARTWQPLPFPLPLLEQAFGSPLQRSGTRGTEVVTAQYT